MEKTIQIKAGGILINNDGKFLAVTRKSMGDLSLPKGRLEYNESIQECAIREVYEETGRKCEIISFIGVLEYTYIDGDTEILSQVHFFTMKGLTQEISGIIEQEISNNKRLAFTIDEISELSNQSDINFIIQHFTNG